MRIAVKAKMREDKQKIRNRSFNELDSLRSIKLKKVSSLSDFYARKQKKRMRSLSSKRPKTPTNYHSRGFGTQWAVRGSNPRPAD